MASLPDSTPPDDARSRDVERGEPLVPCVAPASAGDERISRDLPEPARPTTAVPDSDFATPLRAEDVTLDDHSDVSDDAFSDDAISDPVADATMAKILISARSTRLGRERSTFASQNYTPGYEDALSTKSRRLLEEEMRKLRAARVAESEAETGTGTETETVDEDSSAEAAQSGGDGQPRDPDASSSAPRRATLFQSVSRGAASLLGGGVFFDRDRDEGGSRAGRCTPASPSAVGSRAPSFDDVERGGSPPPRDSERSSARSFSIAAGFPSKPPIRLRRTSSYYVGGGDSYRVGDSYRGAAKRLSAGGCASSADRDDPDPEATREERARRRRNELVAFRLRAASFGKLCATLLAGVLAGLVLWAMTTVTAELTARKFDATRNLLLGSNLGAAWFFYAGCAAAAIGVTALGVLHPDGAPMARGSGIPELKGYLNGNRQQGLFHWRTFAWRSVGICLVITATMPFGREGPSVHIGACVASMALNLPWRARLGWQPSPEERRQILQLGSAAGVAAAFNAPIGGLLYVMEEVASNLPPDYVWRAMITSGMAVGVAQILYSANGGRVDYASLVISDPNSSTGWGPSDLPFVVILAVIAGAFSAAFTRAADFFGSVRRGERACVPAPLRRFLATKTGQWLDAVFGATLLATAQILIPRAFGCRPAPMIQSEDSNHTVYNGRRRELLSSAIYVPRTFVQYTCEEGQFSEMATLMLQNEEGVVKHLFARDELYSEKLFTVPVVVTFFAYFFFMASFTFGGAFPAGVFIPNMLMGATIGRLFGFFAESVVPGANKGTYALIGSAAMLSGFTRMTAAVTVIIIEATASLDVLTPIILSCVVARATAAALVGHNLDERLIIAKGVPFLEHDPHPSTAAVRIGDALREADKRRGLVIAFRPQERLQVLLNALLLTEHNAFPVLDDVENHRGLEGLVTRAMLQRVLRAVLERGDDADDFERAPSVDPDAKTKRTSGGVSSSTRRVSARASLFRAVGLGGVGVPASASEAASPSATPRHPRAPSGFGAIDEWSVEGLQTNDTNASASASASASSLGLRLDASLPSAGDAPPSPDAVASVAAREGNEFMSTLARWVRSAIGRDGAPENGSSSMRSRRREGTSEAKAKTKAKMDAGRVSDRVGAAAAAHDATPAAARADDENHFDELKESLVGEIRRGVKRVPAEQLWRMVDLTHAVDKAPWAVDAAMKLARVHALFARLGIRHLCITSRNGSVLEGIITRHDLIHVHRLAREH